MKKYLTYDDIALVPQYTKIKSRAECSTATWLGGRQFKLPVMPSNMKCVINDNLSHILSDNKYFYVMHRFESTKDFILKANRENYNNISISIGVKKEDYELVNFIAAQNLHVDYITVDIAHGHCEAMENILSHIRSVLPRVFIIAGNVATPKAYLDFYYWGADAVKVGIGQGAACTTKLKTGFTMPMFSCIQKIRAKYDYLNASGVATPPVIIADGGIKYHGDIAKALVAGAHWVMAGGIFAQCKDSPAPTNNIGEKLYYGSASATNKGEYKHVEGTTVCMPGSTHTVLDTFKEITEDLKSAISYSGKTDASQLYKTDYIRV